MESALQAHSALQTYRHQGYRPIGIATSGSRQRLLQMASELPSFFPATLAKAYRSDERDRPASAAQLSASGSPLLDCELVRRYQKQIGAACAYTLVAAIVFGVGYLGAYVVAAESTGVALGVTLGGMLPLCIVLGCCALGIDQSAAAGVVVAGAAIMVIIIPTGALNRAKRLPASRPAVGSNVLTPDLAVLVAQACCGSRPTRSRRWTPTTFPWTPVRRFRLPPVRPAGARGRSRSHARLSPILARVRRLKHLQVRGGPGRAADAVHAALDGRGSVVRGAHLGGAQLAGALRCRGPRLLREGAARGLGSLDAASAESPTTHTRGGRRARSSAAGGTCLCGRCRLCRWR